MLDVKNTTGTVDKITAFGAGAKRAWAYPNNLIEAQKRIGASGHPWRQQVVDAIDNKLFDLVVVTAPGAQLGSNLSQQMAKIVPSNRFTQLHWLP